MYKIKVFMHIDPRRADVFDLFLEMHSKYELAGIKIYPHLGYFPNDKRLDVFYKFCEDEGMSVISHCSPGTPVHYRGKTNVIVNTIIDQGKYTERQLKRMSRKELCDIFSFPLNWESVLDKYKKLNICLAHFGSEQHWDKFLREPDDNDNWFITIREMIEKHKNLYTDISFTLNKSEFFPLLKIQIEDKRFQDKILFGSDYYMSIVKDEERKFCVDLRGYLGERLFGKIATTNPNRFLN